ATPPACPPRPSPAEPITSLHECHPACAVTAAATPAGAAASNKPAPSAAAFRRTTATGSHTRRRRLVPMPVSIKRSRSKVVPHRNVSAKHGVSGSRSDPTASGERNTNSARGRSATAAETGDSRNDQAPPAAPSRGKSMKPSIRPITAQYEVTAATNAKTGSRSHGALTPNKESSAIPALIQSVTHTVLTTAPGSTSSQMSEGSSIGVYSRTSSDCWAFSPQIPIELLIDSSRANDMKNSGSSNPACRAAPPVRRCANWPATPGSCPKSEVPATSRRTKAFRYITQLKSPRRHHELT